MLIKIIVFSLSCFVFTQKIYASAIVEDFVYLFKRAITQGGPALQKVRNDGSFHHKELMSSVDIIDQKLLPINGYRGKLYQEFAQRIETSKKDGKIIIPEGLSAGYRTYQDYTSQVQKVGLDKYNNGINKFLVSRGSFVEQHMDTIVCKTPSPLLLVNAYAENDTLPGKKKALSWFGILEEVIKKPTLGKHRDRYALIKAWQATTNLAGLYIPKGAFVNARIGIAASQTYPNPRSLFSDSIDSLRVAAERDLDIQRFNQDEVKKCYEIVSGGGTQIYFVTISDYTLIDFGSFHFKDSSGQKRMVKYVPKSIQIQATVDDFGKKIAQINGTPKIILDEREIIKREVWSDVNGGDTHLKDYLYDSAEVNYFR